MLDFSRPVTHGAQTEEDWHFEHKAKQHKALLDSTEVIEKVFAEFKAVTGRAYNMVESYLMEDAEVAIVALGTTVETAIATANKLREENGVKVGVVAPRVLRPFPVKEMAEALKGVKAITCMDRSSPNGALGMLYNEVAAALFASGVVIPTNNVIYGLGGRDMTIGDMEEIIASAKTNADAGKVVGGIQTFSGLRGPKLDLY